MGIRLFYSFVAVGVSVKDAVASCLATVLGKVQISYQLNIRYIDMLDKQNMITSLTE